MSRVFTIQEFAPHLHTPFMIAQAEEYELELAEITAYSHAQLEQFSLIFAGPASPWLQQGLYTLVHAEIGECELFLVPLGPDGLRMRYEAAFSRLIQTPG